MRTAEIGPEQITAWECYNGTAHDHTLVLRMRSEDGKRCQILRMSEAEVPILRAALDHYLEDIK